MGPLFLAGLIPRAVRRRIPECSTSGESLSQNAKASRLRSQSTAAIRCDQVRPRLAAVVLRHAPVLDSAYAETQGASRQKIQARQKERARCAKESGTGEEPCAPESSASQSAEEVCAAPQRGARSSAHVAPKTRTAHTRGPLRRQRHQPRRSYSALPPGKRSSFRRPIRRRRRPARPAGRRFRKRGRTRRGGPGFRGRTRGRSGKRTGSGPRRYQDARSSRGRRSRGIPGRPRQSLSGRNQVSRYAAERLFARRTVRRHVCAASSANARGSSRA